MISTLRRPKVEPSEPLLHAYLAALVTCDVMPPDPPVAVALLKASSAAMPNLEEAASRALLWPHAVILQRLIRAHQA